MTVEQIHRLSVALGIKNDLRGSAVVARQLARMKQRFDLLRKTEHDEFDKEDLWNPYSDSRVYTDPGKKAVRRVAMGIDIGTAELLLAYELSKKKPVDLVITHHPVSLGLSALHEVMHMQAELFASHGVPINIAQGLMHERINEVSRKLAPINHQRETDAARLLGLAFMSQHTTTDNMAATFVDRFMKKHKKSIELVSDVVTLLKTIPEYQKATTWKAGPKLFSGNPDHFAGTIAVSEFTGGTKGATEIYHQLAQAGIGTVIGMHMTEEDKKQADESHINVIIAGHMSSDSIGMNLLADELERRGIEIVPIAGFIRVRRGRKR